MNYKYPILIIDDDYAILMALKETFHMEGFECFATIHAQEALEEAKKETFAFAISDQCMAEMTGTQFFTQLKVISPLTSRILITGVLNNEMFLEAINNAEVFRCLAKPWERETLLKISKEAYEHFEFIAAYHEANRSLNIIKQDLVEENKRLKQNL